MKRNTYVAAAAITSECPSGFGGSSLSGGAIAAIAVLVPKTIVLLVAIIVTICLIRLGEISVCVNIFYYINNSLLFSQGIVIVVGVFQKESRSKTKHEIFCDKILCHFLPLEIIMKAKLDIKIM